MSDSLSKVFGLEPLKETLPEPVKEDTVGLDDDAKQARANIKVLIETGNRALEEALNLAIESEQPRAYEVLTNLINTLADLNTKVIDVHSKTVDIKKKESAPTKGSQPQAPLGLENNQPTNVTNNTVFVGTTAELSKFLENLQLTTTKKDVFENEPKQD